MSDNGVRKAFSLEFHRSTQVFCHASDTVLYIPPVVELAEGRSGSALSIQLHRGDSESHKPSKHTLLHVGVLLEGHVLHNWWQLRQRRGRGERSKDEAFFYACVELYTYLVVVSYHDDPFQLIIAILWILKERENR